jgi:hypothetical protein
MKLLVVALLLLCVASPLYAQDAGWSTVATSSDGKDIYRIKLYSGQHSTNGAGKYITVVVGEDESKVTHTTDIMKWYVTDTDCSNGYGNLVMLDMNGNYKYEVPFASGSPTVSSAIAETICAANASVNSGKSLSKTQS